MFDGIEYQLISIDNEARIKANTSDIAKNAAAIQEINDASSGILATAKSYTNDEVKKVSDKVTENTTKIQTNTNAISAINNTSTGILAQAKKYTNNIIPSASVSYATSAGNAGTVNNHTVNANVPSNAVFTDTKYNLATASADGLMRATHFSAVASYKTKMETQAAYTLTSANTGLYTLYNDSSSRMCMYSAGLISIFGYVRVQNISGAYANDVFAYGSFPVPNADTVVGVLHNVTNPNIDNRLIAGVNHSSSASTYPSYIRMGGTITNGLYYYMATYPIEICADTFKSTLM